MHRHIKQLGISLVKEAEAAGVGKSLDEPVRDVIGRLVIGDNEQLKKEYA